MTLLPKAGLAAGLVDAEQAAEDVADLAEGGAAAEGFLHRDEQVLRAPRRGLDVGEGGIDTGLVGVTIAAMK